MDYKIIIGLLLINSFIFLPELTAFLVNTNIHSAVAVKRNNDIGDQKEKLPVIISQPMFYDKNNFVTALNFAQDIPVMKNIQAIIVPHHLLAANFIAAMLKQAGGRQIRTVVVIGPNHRNVSNRAFSSVLAGWETTQGNLEPSAGLIQKFLLDFNLDSDINAFAEEHSIGAIAPFVKYYFPQAKLVPIILSSYAKKKDIEKISNWLKKNLPPESLIVISTDFSHYLSKEQAEKNDVMTRRLILQPDIARILKLTNDNIDSPASLALVSFFAAINKLQPEIVYHGNSFDFLSVKPVSTTSYFGVKYTN
jgi:AmmeMemoRadiSam system protein B